MQSTLRDKGFIYVLIDPFSLKVRYVGQTVTSLKRRLSKHICDSKVGSSHVRCWIRSLINKGSEPIIELYLETSIDSLDECEIRTIRRHKIIGADLTNAHLGGQANRVYTDETRRKISLSLKGKKHSPETIAKRKEAVVEAWLDERLREAARERILIRFANAYTGNKGKPSPKKGKPFAGDRAKLALANREKFADPKLRDEMAVKQGGKPFGMYAFKMIHPANRYRKESIFEIGELESIEINVNAVSKRLGITAPNIRKCLSGQRNNAGGYYFKYIHDEENN